MFSHKHFDSFMRQVPFSDLTLQMNIYGFKKVRRKKTHLFSNPFFFEGLPFPSLLTNIQRRGATPGQSDPADYFFEKSMASWPALPDCDTQFQQEVGDVTNENVFLQSQISSLSEGAALCLMRIECLEHAVDYGLMQNEKKLSEHTDERLRNAEEELSKTLDLIKKAQCRPLRR